MASKNKKSLPPVVRSEGSTAGIQEFCKGIGVEYPDIVAASRRMRKREFEACLDRLILDIIELKIGYSALVIVTNKANPTPRQRGSTLTLSPPNPLFGSTAQGPLPDLEACGMT